MPLTGSPILICCGAVRLAIILRPTKSDRTTVQPDGRFFELAAHR